MNSLLQNIKMPTTRRVMYHLAFWLTLLCVLTLVEMNGGDASFGYFFSNEIVNVSFYVHSLFLTKYSGIK